jgi:hypothetical protein
MERDGATVMPMKQLTEFRYIMGFTGMAVRTNNSEFSERKGILPERSCEIRIIQVKLR